MIDKTYDNLDPFLDKMDYLLEGVVGSIDLTSCGSAGSLMSNAPLATGASRDLIGAAASRTAGSGSSRCGCASNSEYVVDPAARARRSRRRCSRSSCWRSASRRSTSSHYVWRGGFGTAFSFQNTLQRSAPLILTALAVAIPARIGLIMIGGEGALVLGGFVAAAVAIPLIGVAPPMLDAARHGASSPWSSAAFWVGLAGFLRYARGVNETISSLLLTYIGIAIMNFFVEGALRDLSNPNKPSTKPIGDAYMVGKIPGTDVHWGFAVGIVLCIALYFLMTRTTFGFAARVTGGNFRAALAQGLPVGRLIVACSAIAGACAGLAGFFEVAAIQGRANASLAAGYGFTGILVVVPRAA